MAAETQTWTCPLTGRCECGELQYAMAKPAMATHACHCRWCQRQTGSSYALHAMIELSALSITQGHAEEITVTTPSDAGQTITRCSRCHFSLWSRYHGMGPISTVLRSLDVGTLDEPDACPVSFHIYTRHKQRWVDLWRSEVPVFEQLYSAEEYWTPEQLERRNKAAEFCKTAEFDNTKGTSLIKEPSS